MFSRIRDNSKMGSHRELQQALQDRVNEVKTKDSRIGALEQEVRRQDEQIKKLESELDKYRSVLQPPASASASQPKSRLPRLGISAEPTLAKNLEEKTTARLKRHSKSIRQANGDLLISTVYIHDERSVPNLAESSRG